MATRFTSDAHADNALTDELNAAMFRRNLQEFSRFASLASNLETNHKLSADAAFQLVADRWAALERSHRQLMGDAAIREGN
jgi:hypothetical protein